MGHVRRHGVKTPISNPFSFLKDSEHLLLSGSFQHVRVGWSLYAQQICILFHFIGALLVAIDTEIDEALSTFSCCLSIGDMNKSRNTEMGMQWTLPDCAVGRRQVCHLCCAGCAPHKGSRSGGQKCSLWALVQGYRCQGKGCIFIRTRCHSLTKYGGPPSDGLCLPRGSKNSL